MSVSPASPRSAGLAAEPQPREHDEGGHRHQTLHGDRTHGRARRFRHGVTVAAAPTSRRCELRRERGDPGRSVRTRVAEFRDGARLDHEDRVATEEPLEIRVAAPGSPAQRVAVTMRTPGHDFELAAGWLVHERVTTPTRHRGRALLHRRDAHRRSRSSTSSPSTSPLPRSRCRRHGWSTPRAASAAPTPSRTCSPQPLPATRSRSTSRPCSPCPTGCAEQQPGFGRTGGLHAAGLFEADGTPVVVREDVGRHNAVDKVIGSRILVRVAGASGPGAQRPDRLRAGPEGRRLRRLRRSSPSGRRPRWPCRSRRTPGWCWSASRVPAVRRLRRRGPTAITSASERRVLRASVGALS